jgi:hypothetical protein
MARIIVQKVKAAKPLYAPERPFLLMHVKDALLFFADDENLSRDKS